LLNISDSQFYQKGQLFTEPASIPRLKNLCEKRKSKIIGKVITMAESAISDLSIGRIAEELPENAGVLVKSNVKPDESGCFSPERINTCGRKKLFHAPTNEKKATIPARLLEIGSATFQKILKYPQPSIFAASYNSFGITVEK